jgi:hypothetical protein
MASTPPPFMPPKFAPGPPTTEKGVYEDGPGLHVNPANSGIPVYYGGTQTATIVNANPKPPRQTLPSAADKKHSQIPKG